MVVTCLGDRGHRRRARRDQEYRYKEEGKNMPILIVALVALGAWVAIGALLGSAVLLEQHTKKKQAH
jgi:hypothetical protein